MSHARIFSGNSCRASKNSRSRESFGPCTLTCHAPERLRIHTLQLSIRPSPMQAETARSILRLASGSDISFTSIETGNQFGPGRVGLVYLPIWQEGLGLRSDVDHTC